MRNAFTAVFILALFSLLISSATAVAFTPSLTSASISGGQSSQLANFSIQNTGSVNVTQINITLPPTFTFTGTSGTTTSNPYTTTSTPSWTNASTVGIVGNGATQYFWIYVNTPVAVGNYDFNITTSDANGAFNSANVTATLYDITAPAYSSNTTTPSSNSSYVPNQAYWFNITWTDNIGVSKVLIEHNITGSGTPHNETMSNSSSVYSFNTTDLTVGRYVWKVYANDTNNTFNSTSQFTYLVGQANNELRVYLNGSLNRNITSFNNTAVNVTVNASCAQPACTITITRDGGTTIVSGGSNPYSNTNDVITSVGLHNYSISVAGNANYSSNSTTYFVATTPSFSTSTSSIPLTFSNTSIGIINITFDSNPSLVNIYIQGNWTGTYTNHSMTNVSTNGFSYSTVFVAGTHTWKIYGVYSNHSFNLTGTNSFTINKNAPTLTLNITPQWTLDTPVQTNASCGLTVAGLSVALYRNGTSVSNPDVQTFTAGSIYTYLCNSTESQNYTVNTVTNTLVIRAKPFSTLSITQAPTTLEITQKSTAVSEIKIKNVGNTEQNVTLELSGIPSDWYSVNPSRKAIFGGSTSTFTVTFTIDSPDVKEYPVKLNVNGPNGTISQDFTLKVMPSDETKLKINDTIALYKLELSKLESKFNELNQSLNDTSKIDQKITELKSVLKQAEDYVNSNNYFQAEQSLQNVKSLISEIENQLKVTKATTIKPSPKIWLVVLIIMVVITLGFVVYLFWPVKQGYNPVTREYAHKRGEGGLIDTLKRFFSRFRRNKKSGAVVIQEE